MAGALRCGADPSYQTGVQNPNPPAGAKPQPQDWAGCSGNHHLISGLGAALRMAAA
jgi:hypothetical protein